RIFPPPAGIWRGDAAAMEIDHSLEIAAGAGQRPGINIWEILEDFQPFGEKPGHWKGIFITRIHPVAHKPTSFPKHLRHDPSARAACGTDNDRRRSRRIEMRNFPGNGQPKRSAVEPHGNLLQPRAWFATDF